MPERIESSQPDDEDAGRAPGPAQTAGSERDQAHPGFDPLDLFRAGREQPRSLRRLPSLCLTAVRIARSASPRLFVALIALSVVAAAVLGLQVLLGKAAIAGVLDQERTDRNLAAALPAVVGLVAASALGGVASAAQAQCQRLLSEQVEMTMWSSILDVTTSVGLEVFESPRFFDHLQRVRTNALTQPAAMTQGLAGLIGGVLAVVGLAVGLLAIEPVLVPILLAGGGPLWLITRRSGRLEFDFAIAQTPIARLRFYLAEVMYGRDEAKEIRAFELGATLKGRWQQAYSSFLRDLARHVRRRLMLAVVGALVTVGVTTLAVAVLLYSIFEGDLPLASAGAALIAVRLLAGRFQQLFTGIGSIFEAGLFLSDFESFLARRPVTSGCSGPQPQMFDELRLEDVHFRYPGSERDVLEGVSLTIRRGEVIALVGENGSGKTTLAKLLAQLFEPSAGRITWDGVDTQLLDAGATRRHVGIIFQDFIRYQLSARENIVFGRMEAADGLDAVRAAARAGGADGFISRLPAGYETGLGKEFSGGYDLSVGQWQRMALSRAFFRDAGFLVLDEPTASLDARSEHELFEHVRALAHGRSLLLISHRFSTVMSADRIYVLHDGRITEEGSHAELIELDGRYAELFELQARSYR